MAREDATQCTSQAFDRKYSKDKSKCAVTFWFPKDIVPGARSVAVLGTFNDWDMKSHAMKTLKDGNFSLEVRLEAGREYEFRFLVDETIWANGWNADRWVWSEYGNCNNGVITT